MDQIWTTLQLVQRELLLFSAFWFCIGALDDLLDVADRLGMTGFSPATARLGKLTEGIRGLHEARTALEQAVDLADADAHHAAGTSTHISPALQRCREAADYLETLVSDGRWPLPKYRELLFLS